MCLVLGFFYLEFPAIGDIRFHVTVCVYLCNLYCVCVRERESEREEGRKVTCRLSLESGGLSADSLTEGAPSRFGSPQEI